MGLFRRRRFSILRLVFTIIFAAIALYLLFRGVVKDTIMSGIK